MPKFLAYWTVFRRRCKEWLEAEANVPPRFRYESQLRKPLLVQTGPELINRILSCVRLRQSVLLSGPRGSGKSRCIIEAIKLAEATRLRPDTEADCLGGHITVQGNREVSRDYLMTHEILFEINRGAAGGTSREVVPTTLPAPLLKFTEPVSAVNARPKVDHTGKTPQIKRFGRFVFDDKDQLVALHKGGDGDFHFALFLDEVNRFPDGVLDSLLSLLEERTLFIEGDEFKIPVTVLMTMNPPGYDATARQLSPPLLARVGRFWRLASPDLDTLSDHIVRGRREDLAREHRVPIEADAILLRRVCLVTLCLWGDMSQPGAGSDYLTDETVALLARVMEDPVLRREMALLSGLSRYGPDGRAAAEWLQAAAGRAVEKRGVGLAVRVTEDDFLDTAIETLAHRIYDNFSAGSSPAKVRQKEAALRTVVDRVLRANWLLEPEKPSPGRRRAPVPGLARDIDRPAKIKGLMPGLCAPDFHPQCALKLAARLQNPGLSGEERQEIEEARAQHGGAIPPEPADGLSALTAALLDCRLLHGSDHERWRQAMAKSEFMELVPPPVPADSRTIEKFTRFCLDNEFLTELYADETDASKTRYVPCRATAEYETRAEHGQFVQWLVKQYQTWSDPQEHRVSGTADIPKPPPLPEPGHTPPAPVPPVGDQKAIPIPPVEDENPPPAPVLPVEEKKAPPAHAFAGALSLWFVRSGAENRVDYSRLQMHVWKECSILPGVAAFNEQWELGPPAGSEPHKRTPLARTGSGFYDVLQPSPKAGPLQFRASIVAAARWLDELYRRMVIVGEAKPDEAAMRSEVLSELRAAEAAHEGQAARQAAMEEEAARLIGELQSFLRGDKDSRAWHQAAASRRQHFVLAFLGRSPADLAAVFPRPQTPAPPADGE